MKRIVGNFSLGMLAIIGTALLYAYLVLVGIRYGM